MKLFIDTAIISEIKEISQYAFIVGATTNPSLIAKSGQPLEKVIQEICQYIDGPISAEVASLEANGMIEEARKLAKIHKNIVIKLPMTLEGLKAVKHLKQEGIKTNVTLIFNAAQALLAARSGATYVSPFIGRINDLGYDGAAIIQEIAMIFEHYHIETEIIAASIRTVQDVQNAALAGADIATIPYDVLIKSSQHLLTSQGLDIFNEAIKKQKGYN